MAAVGGAPLGGAPPQACSMELWPHRDTLPTVRLPRRSAGQMSTSRGPAQVGVQVVPTPHGLPHSGSPGSQRT